MKTYKDTITLNRNQRGCYIIDTVKGCSGGRLYANRGCYGSCYAKNIADRYGFNFNKVKNRLLKNDVEQLYFLGFYDTTHTKKIIKQIKLIKMPFVRIGEMGDPSEDWEHTLNVCKEIALSQKPIVIVTKHWKIIPNYMLKEFSKLKLCINTSISALDDYGDMKHRLYQFYRLKKYCNSVLRIVSCEFNKKNVEGLRRHIIQDGLFRNNNHIDTIFRPTNDNPFLLKNIIIGRKIKFLSGYVLASIYNNNTYFGKCDTCPDMCGVNLF